MSDTGHATPEDLQAEFQRLGVETETVQHPAVYTVDEAKRLRGELPGAHSKNLFLKDKKGRYWLVVALEDRAVDLRALRHLIGAAPLSFGKPEALMDVLGITPGSVTPFAAINDKAGLVTVVLDAEMLAAEPLNFHPLVNTATTRISAAGLLAFLEAGGHTPLVVTF
jgi:Ala-tRNA(Pro) deacylase